MQAFEKGYIHTIHKAVAFSKARYGLYKPVSYEFSRKTCLRQYEGILLNECILKKLLKKVKASARRLMNIDEEFKGTVLTDSLHITNEFECMGSLC